MRLHCLSLFLLSIIAVTSQAQQTQTSSLNIGDPAPPLRLREWIKGTPVQQFEKGKIYVVEFWATWCGYCIDAMPHLSALARTYKDQVTVLGIDILEKKTTSIKKVKAFVDSIGNRMDYSVAAEDSNFMAQDWLYASGEQGIPATYVVNSEGKIAWIGHPLNLDTVLAKMVSKTWNVEAELAWRNEELIKRKEQMRLAALEHSYRDQLNSYVGDANKPYDLGKPDSALLLINKIVNQEPKLKFAPLVSFHTFSALLKTDKKKAYEYGREMMATPSLLGFDNASITSPIEWYAEKRNLISLPPEFYELGADAYGFNVNSNLSSSGKLPQRYLNSLPKTYIRMAEWYWRAKNRDKAIKALQSAIAAMGQAQEN
ncbi:TlpA family protein disulfide reductase [Paracnuella aquatica]|uniref:TlpA family protein disulfide reductase n=1 Tax=Paracnuella aquatica TaxID=2268757 RepID=UPI000DEFD765|nr:TlpA disulfide reductase family protein [Paracnuella aquatica]RPD43395.1 TlpA family protein disulfide reductase [Paracnuella aquatica]